MAQADKPFSGQGLDYQQICDGPSRDVHSGPEISRKVVVISATELARLWELHAAGLELLARTRCNAAEDCVQEAFVRLSLQTEVPTDPLAWLVKVVRNLAISELRSVQRRRSREKLSSCERLAWHRTQQDRDIDSISSGAVQEALESLDSEMREIVVAHVWNDMSFRQIGSAFEISPAMAHRRYVAALEQLNAGLGSHSDRGDSANDRGGKLK